jgi:hypothetical protein
MLFDISTIEAKELLEAIDGPSCTSRRLAAIYERLKRQLAAEKERAAKRRALRKLRKGD